MNNVNEKIKKEAVGLLFDMDMFLMSVTDNEGWLMCGVPDGEFEEDNKPEVLENYKDHCWLIEDFEGNFDIKLFEEFFETFKSCSRYKYYDKTENKLLQGVIGDFIRRVK